MTRPAWCVLAVLLVALTGCGGAPWEGTRLDEWAWYGCDDLASAVHTAGGGEAFYALTPPQRAPAAGKVAENLGRSVWPLAGGTAAVLQRGASGTERVWQMAADTAAARCRAAGWSGIG